PASGNDPLRLVFVGPAASASSNSGGLFGIFAVLRPAPSPMGLFAVNVEAGLLQPLLGIATLALALKVPSLMGGGAAGGNIVTNLMGTAAGAVVGAGAGIGARAVLGVGTRAISIGAAGSRNGHSASPSAPTGTFIRA